MSLQQADQNRTYGRYRLLDLIGRGNIAEVYKAKSFGVEGFEKTLVVKKLLPGLAASSRFVDTFVREAQMAVRLSHANVVQVFDLGRVDEAPPSYFMASEFVAGVSLQSLLERPGRAGHTLPLEMVVFVGAEMAKALDHAHRRRDDDLKPLGILHRDLTPANVLISWDGEVKVSDFCIGRALHETKPEAIPPAKLRYASPELVRGEPLGVASDLFSLGAVLYHLLAGKPPFSGETREQVERNVANATFEPLDGRFAADHGLVKLIHATLKRDPSARIESAGRLYEALLSFQYSAGVRFGSAEQAELLERLREPVPAPEAASIDEVLAQPTTLAPAVPTPSPAPARAVLPSEPRSAPWSDRREASVLAVRFASPASKTIIERTRQILMRYGASIIEQNAERIGAVFGLQQADGRDTENAVRCGLVLVRVLSVGDTSVAVGVDAGSLRVSGGRASDSGQAKRLVEAAAELSMAVDRRVIIAEQAMPNLRGLFALEPPPLGSDVPGWLVGEMRGPHEAFGRFVGRKNELGQLGEVLANVAKGHGQVVGLVGDHGIGKTRLLYEMERRISRSAFNITTYIAACPPRGHQVKHSALVAMLRTLCGLREGDTPEHVASVRPRLRALGLREEQVQALLAEVSGGAQPENAQLGGLGSTLSHMLARLCEDGAHVFAWDNAQEMDAESVAALHTVADRLKGSRALILFAARPRQATGYSTIRGYREIRLGDLAEDDALRLIALRMGVDEVPEPLFEFVRERAGGHPMFIEELLHEAMESGAVKVRGGRVAELRLGGVLAVPRPLRTLLGDRVRRLPEAEKNLVLAAAVLGAPADTSVLSAMLGLPLGRVNALIESLEAQELVRRDDPVSVGFPTPLLPEVVQADLEPDASVELHQQAVRAYHEVYGDRLNEVASRIAHHHAEAGELDRAASSFAASGLEALEDRRHDHAVQTLVRALELADLESRSDGELAEWIAGLSRAVRLVRSGPRLPELLERLSQHLENDRGLDQRLGVQMIVDVAQMLGEMHHYKRAHRLLQRAVMEAVQWPTLARTALTSQAEVAIRQGDFKLALRAVDEARRLTPDSDEDRHRLLVATAQALAGTGEHAAALQALDEASPLVAPGDPVRACETAKVRALIMGFRRDWAGCAEASEQAAELGRQARLPYEVAVNLHNQGDSLMRLGDLPRAYAALQASQVVAQELGSERLVNLNGLMLSYLDALNGSEEATQGMGERLARAEERKWTWDVLTGRLLLGKLLAQRGDASGAERELRAARQMAISADNRLVADDCVAELEKLGH